MIFQKWLYGAFILMGLVLSVSGQIARFPDIEGVVLDGQSGRLSEWVPSASVMVVLGWSREGGEALQDWFFALSDNPVLDMQGRPVPVYQIALIGPVWDLVRGFIENGMRGGVDASRWGYMMNHYSDPQPVLMTLRDSSQPEPMVFLLNSQRDIIHLDSGPINAQKLQLFQRALTSYTDG